MRRTLPDLYALSFAHTVAPTGAPKRNNQDREDESDTEEEKKEHARWRNSLTPCHDELKFKQGEIVNVDRHHRVCGVDDGFTRLPASFDIPYGEALTTREQVVEMYRTVTMDLVLKELYSNREKSERLPVLKAEKDHAHLTTWDNGRRPQYGLMTVEKDTTLTHTLTGSSLWNMRLESSRGKQIVYPEVGDFCYTDGVIWTNPAPGWGHKSDPYEKFIRVRINIPAGTQVIIDRAPVYGGVPCRYDDDHTSVFPDVLLAPANFLVTSVLHYRSNKEQYEAAEEEPGFYKYVSPKPYGRAGSDEEYAELCVFASNGEFMDIRMTLLEQVKLPDVGSMVWG